MNTLHLETSQPLLHGTKSSFLNIVHLQGQIEKKKILHLPNQLNFCIQAQNPYLKTIER